MAAYCTASSPSQMDNENMDTDSLAHREISLSGIHWDLGSRAGYDGSSTYSQARSLVAMTVREHML